MSTVGRSNFEQSGKRSFWKKGASAVPGSASRLPKVMAGSSSDFEEFNKQTDDAWDGGDDDLLLEAFNVRISRRDVQSAATQVLQSHSQKLAGLSSEPVRTTPDLVKTSHSASSSVPGASPLSSQSNHEAGHRGGPGVGVRLNCRQLRGRSSLSQVNDRERVKLDKFTSLLSAANVNLDELRKISWSGIPARFRPITWKLLSGFVSPNSERREAMLERKRLEYHNFVEQYYSTRHQDIHRDTYRQIHIDIPRMCPLIPLFQQTAIQQVFERILYIWAIRHPASGYVQGINDLVTPFFVVFLSEYLADGVDVADCELESLAAADVKKLEADCFWCFSKLLDGIQDNYTFAQPGIQKRVNSLKELVSRIDNSLHRHIEHLHVEYLQFAFRWMNNLLMREMPLHCVIRLWDTYLSEPDGFATFHLYVCASFLMKFSADLQLERDFQGLMVLLQGLPTEDWTDEEVGLVLADAYRLKFMFADAPKHLGDATS